MISFETEQSFNNYKDFELKSKDIANFIFKENKVYIIINFTINQYKKFDFPKGWKLFMQAFGIN
jgi:translation initiation factor IF-3